MKQEIADPRTAILGLQKTLRKSQDYFQAWKNAYEQGNRPADLKMFEGMQDWYEDPAANPSLPLAGLRNYRPFPPYHYMANDWWQCCLLPILNREGITFDFVPLQGNYTQSEEEGLPDGREIRTFIFPTVWKGLKIIISVGFFHSHERLEFPEAPLIRVTLAE